MLATTRFKGIGLGDLNVERSALGWQRPDLKALAWVTSMSKGQLQAGNDQISRLLAWVTSMSKGQLQAGNDQISRLLARVTSVLKGQL